MKITLISICFILCFFILSGCNSSVADSPSFETIQDLKFTKFKKRKLNLEGVMVFKNSTSFDVQLDVYGIDIFYNGKKIDNIQTKKNTKIKAGEQYNQYFVSIVKSLEILPIISGKTWKEFDHEEIDIEIKGEALAKFQNKTYTIEIAHHQSLELKKDGKEEQDGDSETEVD